MVAGRISLGVLRQVVRFVLYGLPAIALTALLVVVIVLENRPDLEVWHLAKLQNEYEKGDVPDFVSYLALEEVLFAELDAKVRQQVPEDRRHELNRFVPGSLSDPERISPNWNRSFEWPAKERGEPSAAVLLVHGLSDSPYSLRSVAKRLHESGAWVVGLRVPGHGTAPSGLVTTDWQDMAAALGLAANHLRDAVPGAPLVIVGYSNGAALAVDHALDAIEEDRRLPPGEPRRVAKPDALVLLSPAIGVTPLAAFASWQETLGQVTGLEKIDWNSILLEYDPYKYSSFALHAGKQAFGITTDIRARLAALDAERGLHDFPPTLAFQSLVDATVSTRAVVDDLFRHLHEPRHELVIFDVRRGHDIEQLMGPVDHAWLEGLRDDAKRRFTLTVVTNEGHPQPPTAFAHRHTPGAEAPEVEPTGAAWPDDLFSLAHVSLPFPPDDPVYGGPAATDWGGIQLGQVAARGERGVLLVSPSDMLRLRWNPFHRWMLGRIDGFVSAAPRD